MDRVEKGIAHIQRRRHVVSQTRDSRKLRRAVLSFPDTEEADEKVLRKTRVEHLADKEDVGGESGLQHDGHVGGVEETDWVRAAGTTLARGLDGDLDAETLEVDDGGEDSESGQQVHDVGEVLSVESLLEGTLLVGPGHQEVEEGDDGTLELGTTTSVDGGRRESLPHDRLANVGGNEQRNTTAETVSLLQELIEQDDNHTGNDKLEDQEEDNTGTKVGGGTIETGEDVDGGSTTGEDEGKELLGGLVEFAVGLEVKVDVDHVGTGEELENHARGDNWCNTQLHQSSSITRHHHPQPV